MKIKLLLAFFLLSLINTNAQYELDINNVRAHFEQNGMLFNNSTTFNGGFEAPKDSGLHSFYAFNFWVGGIFDTVIYAHGARFLQLSDATLRFGPMMDSIYYETENDIWDRVWNVTKADIDYHIINFESPGYILPDDIEDWPAHGDVSKGQAADLAPFVDVDNNGIYEPTSGDYPLILGDQAIYVIYNGERSNDDKDPMGIESHVMLYSYADDELLDEVVYAYVKHYNRSPKTYINAYLGMFSDIDLGNTADDFGFTDVNRSTVFAENGDAVDENGYEEILPFQSATLLRGTKQDNDQLDNAIGIEAYQTINGIGYGDGVIDNEYRGLDYSLKISNNSTSQGDPQTAVEYYNTMSGHWRDGTPIVYGGDGYTSDSLSVISRFTNSMNDSTMFGTYGVEPQGEWNSQIPTDIRLIGSSGPFIFEAGSCRDMYMAFVFERPGTGNYEDDFNTFTTSIDYVKENFEIISGEQCSEITTGIKRIKRRTLQGLQFYPNPTNGLIFFVYEGNDANALVSVYDSRGKLILETRVNPSINSIDLSSYEGKIFLIKLIDNAGVFTQKVFKN
jgi:hypothetical protein